MQIYYLLSEKIKYIENIIEEIFAILRLRITYQTNKK